LRAIYGESEWCDSSSNVGQNEENSRLKNVVVLFLGDGRDGERFRK
jgi:hypothetical protein